MTKKGEGLAILILVFLALVAVQAEPIGLCVGYLADAAEFVLAIGPTMDYGG
jgi:hypothetical protein